jgi:hypothetical protein
MDGMGAVGEEQIVGDVAMGEATESGIGVVGARPCGGELLTGRGRREATHAGRLTDDAPKTGMWDGRWRSRDDRTAERQNVREADYSYLLNK